MLETIPEGSVLKCSEKKEKCSEKKKEKYYYQNDFERKMFLKWYSK